MEFNIDFGAFREGVPQNQPLHASVAGRVSALSDEEVVFYDPRTDQAHVMTQQVLQAMDLCRPFRTLDEHAQFVAGALPQLKGQQAAVKRVLEGLAKRGLLRTGGELLGEYAAVSPSPLPAFSGFFVRACGRPQQVQRLLDSVLDDARAQGNAHALTLIDDSTDPASAREHATLLRSFADASGAPARYIGREQWRDFVATLSEALPEHAGAIGRLLDRDPAFLGRRGGGTGKNLAALLSAGSRMALLDDDFLFPLHRHPEYRPGLGLEPQAWAPRTYSTPEQALAAGEPRPDAMTQQLALCGARLGAVVNRVEGLALGPAELRQLVPSRVTHLVPDARVLATVNGHRGDAGASGMAWLFALDPVARAGFAGTRTDYLAALERPAVWHGARRWQVLRGANFTPFLVDNSQPMPCTSPYGRSEDALFSALSAAWWPNGVVVGTPDAIGHLQEGARGRQALLQRPETPDINLCIAEFVRHAGEDLQGCDPVRRNAVLVARLRDMADGEHRALVAYLREYLAYLRTSIVQALQQSLAQAKDPPIYWAADLRKLVEVNGRAIASNEPPRFAGWPEDADEQACVAAFRRELTTLADGLDAWPTLWDSAREIAPKWLERQR